MALHDKKNESQAELSFRSCTHHSHGRTGPQVWRALRFGLGSGVESSFPSPNVTFVR